MEVFHPLQFLSFVISVVLIHICPSDSDCNRQIFYEYKNKSYDGDILIQKGPWPLYKCRR